MRALISDRHLIMTYPENRHTHIHSAHINKLMAFIITYSIYSNTPINALDVFFRENILNAKLGGERSERKKEIERVMRKFS